MIFWLDALRWVSIAGNGLLVGATLYIAISAKHLPACKRSRFTSLALAALTITLIEVERLGGPFTWVLAMSLAVLATGGFGVGKMIWDEVQKSKELNS